MSEQLQQILLIVGLIVVVGAAAFFFGRRSARRHSMDLPRSEEHASTQSVVALPAEHDETSRHAPHVEEAPRVAHVAQPAVPAVSWLSRLSSGLSQTQTQLVRQLDALFTSQNEKASREAILDGMLEVLVRADVGIRTAELLIEKVRHDLPSSRISDAQAVKDVLRREMLRLLKIGGEWKLLSAERRPTVVLMVGVNGVGKTTTSGKLAFKERQVGKSVIVGAADTFRAAAVDQLEEWARRAGAECVRLAEGADPASVAFECVKRAVAQQMDLCLIDTAGRLHNRQDLMQELAKIKRVTSRDVVGAPHEVLLVLDATTGQNALQQAKAFRDIAGVTGLVLTKLDGTAKGGVAIALAHELQLPIRYIGVGESVDDLQPFSAEEFVDALFAPQSSQIADSTSRSAATGSATF